MSSAAVNPPSSQSSASQTQTTAATKPAPHGRPKSLEQPRQRRRLDPENEDDETAVATSAEGSGSGAGSGSGPSSQGRAAALPKDSRNDATRSEYTVSSEEEEDNTPVSSKRSRGSTTGLRMKAVRESNAPSRYRSSSRSPGPVLGSEGPAASRACGRKGSSLSRRSMVVCVPRRVTPSKRCASKRPTGSNVSGKQLCESLSASQKKPVHRSQSADGHLDFIEQLREHQRRRLSAHSPLPQAVASGHTCTTPAPASAGAPTPKPQVTSAGSAKPPGDDGSAPVMQFLAGIGLGQSHFQILTQEGIRTQRDLDDLQKLEKDSIVELMDVLRARGFTAFEFSKFLYRLSRKKD